MKPSRASAAAASPLRKPSARQRPTPPTTWTCAASRFSLSQAPPRASSPNTTPPRPSSRSARVEVTVNRLNLLWGTTPIRCPKVNSTEALVDCAETLLENGGYVRPREVIAIVAGTRTKSGSTNFLRLHAMGENLLNGLRFRAPRAEQPAPAAAAAPKKRRAARPAKPPKRETSGIPPENDAARVPWRRIPF